MLLPLPSKSCLALQQVATGVGNALGWLESYGECQAARLVSLLSHCRGGGQMGAACLPFFLTSELTRSDISPSSCQGEFDLTQSDVVNNFSNSQEGVI